VRGFGGRAVEPLAVSGYTSAMKIRVVREERSPAAAAGHLDVLVHPEWASTWPWLAQGTTVRGVDFALAAGGAPEAWAALGATSGCAAVVHARQPHGAAVGVRGPGSAGFHLAPDADAHLTRSAGTLLGVTTADCVPATLVHPGRRVVGIVHAGWRGAAAGILERAIRRLEVSFGLPARELHLHLGPSICGACYEVGPEVHDQLGLDAPEGPTPVDLPAALADRAVARGLSTERVTRSGWCTLCTGRELLYSHRGGDAGRQVGFVGVRPAGPGGA